MTLRDLVRPQEADRLVVGEVRGAEVSELLAALNHHDGGCGTCRANEPWEVRLEPWGWRPGWKRCTARRRPRSAS